MAEANTKLLRIQDVLERVPVSRTTLGRMINRGEFPKAVAVGGSRMWVESEIEQWKQELIEARE